MLKQSENLDAIILCAGDFVEGKIQEVDRNDFIRNMDVNFNYYAVNEVISLLKRTRCSKIIIIGSTAAYNSYSVPIYSITKWALRGYVINLREELWQEGIGVTFISPGATLTDMWTDVELSPDRLLMPDDIAKVVDNLFELSEQAIIEELIIRPIQGDIDE
ncbi:MAG: SDR family oxidoreductase [Clostridiales bacterium]|nr:SDR family oxidoreductase [Clostridiales bacterium]